jgi:eukaryotic-like serine/threonine-protein kinase
VVGVNDNRRLVAYAPLRVVTVERGSHPIATQRLLNGRYELGPILGRGGMSEVRRGFDTVLLRPVAIKLLRDEGDRTSVARFEREAHVLAHLEHPNVVAVFDVGADGTDRYIVMELVEGPTLRDVLDESQRLQPARAVAIAAGVAAALAYAHDRNVVHRDVKPSNVLMAPKDRVKLADLGIAKLLNAETLATRTGLLGTANYMAPEQVQAGPVDGRTDLYSLGCVLFEMLVGRPPFEGNLAAIAYAHVHTPAPRSRSVDPAVPEPLDSLVASLLEKDPSARPQNASEVQAALGSTTGKAPARPAIPSQTLRSLEPTRWLPEDREPRPPVETLTSGEPTTERLPPKRPPSRRWIVPAAATLVGLLLVVLLPVLFAGDSTPNEGGGARSPQSSPSAREEPPPGPLSASEAAQHVFDVVSEGIAAGEVTGGIVGEIQHKIDEAFKELGEHEDPEKALDKIEELQEKVDEALEKGEIRSPALAQAIDDALDELAGALEAEA